MEMAMRLNPFSIPNFNPMRNINRSLCSAVACLMIAVMFLAGCTPAQKQTTLQIVTTINTHVPEVVAAADTVAATMTALLPADAILIGVTSTAFDTLAKSIQALTASYIANPNATTLQQLQGAVNALESQINVATLGALKIVNPVSQQLAIAALKGLLTVVTIIFGMIAPTESLSMLKTLRDSNTIHLAKVRQYMDQQKIEVAAKDAGVDINAQFDYATAHGF